MRANLVSLISLARIPLLLVIVSISGCRNSGENLADPAVIAKSGSFKGRTYESGFQRNENPINENGSWMVGSSGGSSLREGGHFWRGGRLWGDVQISSGLAYGVDEPTEYGDPTAILAGVWGPNQTVTAIVRIKRLPKGSCCHEVELRLRTAISRFRITGYEAYCSIMPNYPYCHIARWNGPNGSYWNFETQTAATYLADGDVIKASVSGTNPTIITLFKNDKQVAQGFDTGAAGGGFGPFGPWTSGSPGMGFYDQHDGDWKDFGFSSFSATDIAPITTPYPSEHR
jgi:hypothetical protein